MNLKKIILGEKVFVKKMENSETIKEISDRVDFIFFF